MAHASVFGNDEKVNIVRRALLGAAAAGVARVVYMPDPHALVRRAAEEIDAGMELVPAQGDFRGDARDNALAAKAMAEAGVGAIVSLGGDGTNRMIAKGMRDVPLIPISTGTNNVFPVMVEGTVAGLAAGALATGVVDPDEVAPRCKLVEIELAEAVREIALIDVVVMAPGFTAGRAIWETGRIRAAVLTRAEADAVGMSAVGGMLEGVRPSDEFGLHLEFGPGGPEVAAAIAPGLVRPVSLSRVERLALGAPVQVHGPALLPLDGERELLLPDGSVARMTITRSGPPVVDIRRCLEAARESSRPGWAWICTAATTPPRRAAPWTTRSAATACSSCASSICAAGTRSMSTSRSHVRTPSASTSTPCARRFRSES